MGARENESQISKELWKHSQNSEKFMGKMSFCEVWHLVSRAHIRNFFGVWLITSIAVEKW